MNVTIEKIDIENCGEYSDNEDCLLATAAKRQFKTERVSCDDSSITIDGHDYHLKTEDNDFLHSVYVALNSDELMPQLPHVVELEPAR